MLGIVLATWFGLGSLPYLGGNDRPICPSRHRLVGKTDRLVKAGFPGEFIRRAGGAVIDLPPPDRPHCERAGSTPDRFAWLALGSWGRCERTLIGDQDHALTYYEPSDCASGYFSHD